MVNLYIEGQLIDQYSDESVEIVSSVLDVQDLNKNTGDYSKSFTIPTPGDAFYNFISGHCTNSGKDNLSAHKSHPKN